MSRVVYCYPGNGIQLRLHFTLSGKGVEECKRPIEECLLGFFKVILDLQSHFSGALVLVLGPVMPYVNEQLDRYKALKEKANQLALFAKTLGKVLGIPVVQTLVQTTYNADLGFVHVRAPLFAYVSRGNGGVQ